MAEASMFSWCFFVSGVDKVSIQFIDKMLSHETGNDSKEPVCFITDSHSVLSF